MSTATGTAPAAAADRAGHATFGRLMLAEWTKLRSVRSTVYSLAAFIVVDIGFTSLFTWLDKISWNQQDGVQKAQQAENVVSTIAGAGLLFGQLAICVLGVLVATNEYSTGMIRSTLLATPHRLHMLAAKCAVFAGLVFVLSEILAFITFFIGKAVFASIIPVSLSDPGVTRAVFGEGLFLGLLALFALAIGQLIRHTAGAITAVIGLVLVLVPLSSLIPGKAGKYVSAYLPTNAGHQITVTTMTPDMLLGPWQGLGIFALWTAALMALAGWLLVRRDA
jgi:ABC-2 type transport system permease protein